MISRAIYRTTQFFSAINATVTSSDCELAQSVLGKDTPALALFNKMNDTDQYHAIAVLHSLEKQGFTQPVLQKTALLHDVGKILGQPLLHRIIVVILKRFYPALLQKLADAPLNCPKWRQPFVINFHHPQIGAEMAKEAGCEPLVVKLIAAHQGLPKENPSTQMEKFHAALYAADNEN